MSINATRRIRKRSLRRGVASLSRVALIIAALSPCALGQSVTQGYGYPASNNAGYPSEYLAGLQNNPQPYGANYSGNYSANYGGAQGGQSFQNIQNLADVQNFQSLGEYGGQYVDQYSDQYGAQYGQGNASGYGNLITTSNPDVPPQYALDENGAIIPFPTEVARAGQRDVSGNAAEDSDARPVAKRLDFGERRTALDIWSEFLFGKKKPNRSRSLFAQPKRPATVPTDKLEPNPLFRLLTFGLFSPKAEESEIVEGEYGGEYAGDYSGDYYGYESQTFDAYGYQEGFSGNYFGAAPGMTGGYENFGGYQGGYQEFGEQYQPEYQRNAFLPAENYLGHNGAAQNARARVKATQGNLPNETRLASATRGTQGKATRQARPTNATPSASESQVARANVQRKGTTARRNENALATNAPRDVAQKGTRSANAPRAQGGEAFAQKTRNAPRANETQPRREAPQVAQNERASQKGTNLAEISDEEVAAARKRRLQELNSILAAKRPTENASHIQQTSALVQAPRQNRPNQSQNQLEARSREIKSANAQFQEAELERYRNSNIRQASHVELQPQRAAQASARPTLVAKPVQVSPPKTAAKAPKRTITPRPVPTYDSTLTEEENSELDDEEVYEEIDDEAEEDAAPAVMTRKPVVKRPKAQFIDPNEYGW